MKTKEQLIKYRESLSNIRTPTITAQMRHGGLKTRPQRQAIIRYRREIEKELKRVDKYLEKEDVSQFSLLKPKLKKTRREKKKRRRVSKDRWV